MSVPFGKYQLLKKLARGGMGQVFLARSEGAKGFEKLVVIKRILPHLVEDEDFLNMFFDEARLAARLNHPNIAQIFDLGEVNGSYFIAMEYVAGEDLRRLERHGKQQNRPLTLGLMCRIIADAAAGLDHAHKVRDNNGTPLQLVHRDVSPQNVLVGFDGGVKLIDFGVARAVGRLQVTTSGVLKGKYPYMSPEQMDGEKIDARSDVFALGIVFWEILTGKRLFKGEDDLQTMKFVRECNVPRPSSVAKELPAGIDAVVMRALAKSPAQRYSDAQAFRVAIDEFAIHHKLPASSSHLVAYMHSLYADRIGKGDATLDELAPDAVLDMAPPTQSTPISASQVRSVLGTPPSTEPVPPGKKASSRGLIFGAVAVALAITLGGGLWGRLHSQEVNPVVEPPTRPNPPVSSDVIVRLRSTPPGADVLEGGTHVGTTPVELKFSKEKVHALSFKLGGYANAERTLDLSHLTDGTTELNVVLEAAAAPQRPNDATKPRTKKDPEVHVFE